MLTLVTFSRRRTTLLSSSRSLRVIIVSAILGPKSTLWCCSPRNPTFQRPTAYLVKLNVGTC